MYRFIYITDLCSTHRHNMYFGHAKDERQEAALGFGFEVVVRRMLKTRISVCGCVQDGQGITPCH